MSADAPAAPAVVRASARTVAELLTSPQAAVAVAARAAFARPGLVAAAALLLVCVPNHSGDVATSVHVTPVDLGGLAVVGAVTPRWLRVLAGRAPAVLSRAAACLLAAVLCSIVLATLTSTDPDSSLSGLLRYLELFILLPAAMLTATRRREDRIPVLGAAIAVGLFESILGTWQTLTHNGASYAGTNVRAVGTFGSLDIMGMATVVSLGLIAATAVAVSSGGRERSPRARRIRTLAWCAAALMVPGLICSLSRGAWIAAAVAVGVICTVAAWRTVLKTLLIGAVAGFVVLGALGSLNSNASSAFANTGSVTARFSSIFNSTSKPDQSVTDRYSLWTAAEHMWETHPVTGIGLKQFSTYRDSSAPLSLSNGSQTESSVTGFQVEPILSPHNMYFLTLAEQGLPGALVFAVVLVGLPLLALRRSSAEWHSGGARAAPDPAPWLRAGGLAAAGFGLWMAVDYLYADIGGPSTVYGCLLLGLVLGQALPRPATARQSVLVFPTPQLSALTRGAVVTTVFNLGGSVFGLARDLLLARFFGASGTTDAFLVAWTVPETASPLLIEDGMSYVMVPIFSRAAPDRRSTRYAVNSTWLPLVTVLSALAGITALAAPAVVHLLAPGLADPALAITCTRLTSVTVLLFGLTGYGAAALRTRHVFGPPAAIYVAYNLGILTLMILGRDRWGVTAAAAGVAFGAALMVLVQLPSFLRVFGAPGRPIRGTALLTVAAVLPVVTFTLARQAQTFVERYLGSELSAGNISYLNYAQKVGQVPMSVGVMLTAVSFPTLSRALQSGRLDEARRRIKRDLGLALLFGGAGTLFLIATAPLVIRILFQHGEFTAHDTAATATILRVYVLGLLGQTAVGVTVRLYFSRRVTWYPAVAMLVGLVVTAVVGKLTLHSLGASGIALGNAVGITVTALALLAGARRFLIPRPAATNKQEEQ
jgi:putative peptidoglycan lipid II flippase